MADGSTIEGERLPGDRGLSPDAADRFSQLWLGDHPPELDGFLSQAGELSPDGLAGVLRVDQAHRWERGERPGVEDYLRKYPRVRGDRGAALDLIHHEFLLRERLGEQPALDEYLVRFSEYASEIRDQVELHVALASNHDPGRGQSSTAPAATRHGPPAGMPGAAFLTTGVFGRYQIVQEVGRGGMGTVYLARDTKLDRRVALKVLHFGDDSGGRLARRFLREAKIAATLSHPNLCPVYDAGEQDGLLFLTMPFLEGETLAAKLKREGSLTEADAARIAARIARALGVVHRAGIIHRDVKPANVMIGGGEPIVLDFGLARRDASLESVVTEPGLLLGTPAYIAPEQIGGDPDAMGPACDIYALGAVLYQMLTGGIPFTGASAEILRQVLTRPPDPPSRRRPGLDPRLEAICLTALAKDPEARFPTMDAFADALEAFLAHDRPEPRVRILSRRRAGRLVLLGGLATLLGVLAWATIGRRPQCDGSWGDRLVAGDVWAGRFRFRPPIEGYSGDVFVTIRESAGGRFRGNYQTEGGQFEWDVEGTVRDGGVRWEFTRAIKDNPKHNVVGRAWVEGRIGGADMTVVFTNPGNGVADMTLRRSGR